MVELRDQCLLRIVGADDVEVARAVLGHVDALAREIAPSDEAAVSFVSEVMVSPAGPMVLMDAKGLGRRELERLLDALVETAERLGLRSGTIEVPRSGRLRESLVTVRLGVLGTIRPPVDLAQVRVPRRLPSEWLRVAARWLGEPGWEPVVVSVAGVESEIEAGSVDAWLGGLHPARTLAACGSVESGMRLVGVVMNQEPRLSFLSTGRGSARLREEGEHIRELVRSLAATSAYAYVTPVPRARSFGIGDEDLPASFHPGLGARLLPDDLAVDGFWCQVLGPGHVARTGALPGVEPLGDGRVGLTIGGFEGWVDEVQAEMQSIDPGPLRARGRALLGPCFLDRREARGLRNERRGND